MADKDVSCGSSLRSRFRLATLLVLLLAFLISIFIISPVREAGAIPAWARKYNADCAMCHYPVYPRLNSFGQQFRRAGYRTPVEFGKDQDVSKIGNFLAGKVRTQLSYTDNRGEIDRTEFRLAEASLIYAGAFTRNFSAYLRESTFGGNNAAFAGKVYGVFGSSESFFTIRAGQMNMLYLEGFGGLDRPTLIGLNPVYSLQTTAQGTPQRFTFFGAQRGVELAYVRGPGRLLFQVSNGLDQNGSGTGGINDIDRQKDFLVAYEHILDEIASGFTVFYYNGTTHGTATTASSVLSPIANSTVTALGRTFSFDRYGFNLNKVFPLPGGLFFEVQGGFVRSNDRNPITAGVPGQLHGNAWYIEGQQYIPGPELTFVERYSVIDNNGPNNNTTRKDYTFGVVTPIQTWLRMTAEYTYTDNRNVTSQLGQLGAGQTGHLALLEAQAVW
jgi:hypothetical protein